MAALDADRRHDSPDADLCALHGRAAGRHRQSARRARCISIAATRTPTSAFMARSNRRRSARRFRAAAFACSITTSSISTTALRSARRLLCCRRATQCVPRLALRRVAITTRTGRSRQDRIRARWVPTQAPTISRRHGPRGEASLCCSGDLPPGGLAAFDQDALSGGGAEGSGAVKRTRTSTPVKELAPQASASTSSAMTAHFALRQRA